MIENKEFALEFAKWLLKDKTVTQVVSMTKEKTYRPKEYDLLLGEIILNGEQLIKDFWFYKMNEATFNINYKKEQFYKELYKKMFDDFVVYGEVIIPSDIVEKFRKETEE